MRWELQLAVLLGLSFSDVASLAQRPPDDEGLASASSESDVYPIDAGYFDSDGVVRFHLIQGRLGLDPPRHRKGTQHCDRNGVYESITITATRGVPSVHYIHRTPKHETILSVEHADAVRIESRLLGSGELAIIDQPIVRTPSCDSIRWTVSPLDLEKSRDQTKRFAGATLLHLRSADEQSFDRHFASLFRQLLRGQTLQTLCEQTDAELIRRIQEIDAFNVVAINESIDQLASPKLAIRRGAQRHLLSCGSPIVPIIHQRRVEDLDREQVARLHEITSMLQPLTEDTPASLAALLVNDVDHWSRMASRLNADQIQMANHYLRRVGLNDLPEIRDSGRVERVAQNDASRY